MGAEVVLSTVTTKEVLNGGVKQAVDEACLPIKVFFGHVLSLRDKVDYLFIPRMVSVERREYTCPKLLGLPDMVMQTVPGLPPVLTPCINLYHGKRKTAAEIMRLGRIFGAGPLATYRAYRRALAKQHLFGGLLTTGCLPPEAINRIEKENQVRPQEEGQLKIALIGHGYNIYDNYVSMNLINKLRKMGIVVVTQDLLSTSVIAAEAAKLPKAMFWTYGKQMIGAASYFLNNGEVDGIIYLTAFGCGPDSLIGELMEREAQHRKTIPYILLTIDEHSGEAGIQTRLEAFIDMIKWRSTHESYISTHGDSIYTAQNAF